MTIVTGRDYRIDVASLPDRDDLVVEIWFGDRQFAEVRCQQGALRLQIFAAHGAYWDIPYDVAMASLLEARERLERLGPPRGGGERLDE